MIKQLLIIFFVCFVITSCTSKPETNKQVNTGHSVEKKVNDEVEIDTILKEKYTTIERLFPKDKSIEKFDSVLNDQNIHIFLEKRYLESYVIDKYEMTDTIYLDQYLNSKFHLIIKKEGKILTDTVLIKSTFTDYSDNGFLEIAIFHKYWFRELENGRLEFFGVISKPETDWSFAFSHYFDLENNKWIVEPYIEEPI